MPNPAPDKLTADQYARMAAAGFDDAKVQAYLDAGLRGSDLDFADIPALAPTTPAPAPAPATTATTPPPGVTITPQAPVSRAGPIVDVTGAGAKFLEQETNRGEGARAGEILDDLSTQQFTPGGVPRPGVSFALTKAQERALDLEAIGEPSGAARVLKVQRGEVPPEFVGSSGFFTPEYRQDLLGSLLPQEFASREQLTDQDRMKVTASRVAAAQLKAEILAGQHPSMSVDDIDGSAILENRRNDILSGRVPPVVTAMLDPRSFRRADATLRGAFDPGDAAADVASSALANLKANASVRMEGLGTTRTSRGTLVESPMMHAGRVLGGSTSALVGAADPNSSVPERIQEGEGLIAGGEDAGRWLAGQLDMSDANVERMASAGKGLGFVGELFMPLDLGATKGLKAARKGAATFGLAQAAGAPVSQSVQLALKNALYPGRRNTANSTLQDLIATSDATQQAASDMATVLLKPAPDVAALRAADDLAERAFKDKRPAEAADLQAQIDDALAGKKPEDIAALKAEVDDLVDEAMRNGLQDPAGELKRRIEAAEEAARLLDDALPGSSKGVAAQRMLDEALVDVSSLQRQIDDALGKPPPKAPDIQDQIDDALAGRKPKVVDDRPELPARGTIDDALLNDAIKGDYEDATDFLDEMVGRRILKRDAADRIIASGRTMDALRTEMKTAMEVAESTAKRTPRPKVKQTPESLVDEALGGVKRADDAAQAEHLRDVLAVQSGRQHIIEGMLGGGLRGDMVMLSPRLTTEQGNARALFKEYTTTPIGKTSRQLVKKPKDYVLPSGRIDLLSAAQDAGVKPEALAEQLGLGRLPLPKLQSVLARVDRVQLRSAQMRSFEDFALRSKYDVQQVRPVEPLGVPRLRDGEAPAPSALEATPLEVTEVKRAMTPLSMRPGVARQFLLPKLDDAKASLGKATNADTLDPALQPLLSELVEKWGSIQREQMLRLRQAPGNSRPEQTAHVMAELYDSNLQYVSDILSNYYGGFESLGEMVSTTAMQRQSQRLGPPPAQIRAGMRQMLRRAAQGKPVEGMTPEVQQLLARLYTAAKNPQTSPVSMLSELVVALRGLEEVPLSALGVTTKADEALPIFKGHDIGGLLQSSYYQRRSGQLIGEVFSAQAMLDAGMSPYTTNAAMAVEVLRDSINTDLVAKGLRPLNQEDTAIVLGEMLGMETSYRTVANRSNLEEMINEALGVVPKIEPVDIEMHRWLVSYKRFRDLGYDDATILAIEQRTKKFVDLQGNKAAGRTTFNEAAKGYIQRILDGQMIGPASVHAELGVPKQLTGAIIESLDLRGVSEMLQQMKAGTPEHNRFFTRVLAAVSDAFLKQGSGRAARWVKGGLLAGRLMPNAIYMSMNYMTAPAIIASTLGMGAAARAVARMVPRDMGEVRALSYFYGGAGDGNAIALKTPQGVVYTVADLAEVFPRISSQSGMELSGDQLRSMQAWSGLDNRKLQDPGITDVAQMGQGRGRRALRQWTGLDFAPELKLGKGKLSVEVNASNEFAQATDMYFRAGAMMDSLKAGSTMDEAVAVANASLLDYNAVSALERATIGKAWWFWSFQRENLRAVMTTLVENPQVLRAAYQSTNLFDDDTLYHEGTKDYLQLRPVVAWVEDPKTQRRYAIYGPSVPMLDGMSDLVDVATISAMMLGDGFLYTAMAIDADPNLMRTGDPGMATRAVRTGGARAQQNLMRVLSQANPLWSGGYEAVLGVTIDGTDQRDVGTYLDPKWMALMASHPHILDLFDALVGIEVVPSHEEKPGRGTFQGHQWRIQNTTEAKRRWQAMQYAMLGLGVGRTLRDYAPTIYRMSQWARGEGIEDAPIQVKGIQGATLHLAGGETVVDSAALAELLRYAGFGMASEQRTAEEASAMTDYTTRGTIQDATD